MAKKMKYKACEGCATYKGICDECTNGNLFNDPPKKLKKPIATISNYSTFNLFPDEDIENDMNIEDYACEELNNLRFDFYSD